MQENERQRIARELHDELGQMLCGLAIEVGRLSTAANRGEDLGNRFQTLSELVDQMSRQLHLFLWELRPALLDDLGLLPALTQLLETWSQRTGVRGELRASGLKQRLPADHEAALYRIVQEALCNIARHAKATSVSVNLAVLRGRITVKVQDDGQGFDVGNIQRGSKGRLCLGLQGIGERAALLGGSLEIESQPGSGTLLRVVVPIQLPDSDENPATSHHGSPLEINDLRAQSDRQRMQMFSIMEAIRVNRRHWSELRDSWLDRSSPQSPSSSEG